MKPKNCMNCKHSIQYSYGVFCTWCEPVEIIVVRPKLEQVEGETIFTYQRVDWNDRCDAFEPKSEIR